ncbi:MAG TPA: pre-peptidase C-terminal domain-containing protein [Gemmatimonadaceae bacterium]|nr:pre-peptidase C-terminal domain-containing protein [Gemmatimonadaceae bacterium]
MLPRSAYRLSCALLAALAFAGCNDDGTPGPDDPGLVVTPLFRGVPETDTLRLSATMNGAPVTATWASSDTTIARVSADGLVTALAPGFAAITATGPNNTKRSASITVIAVPTLTSGTGVTIAASTPRFTFAYRKIVVPAGATNLTITISGGSGDVDMFVARGGVPSQTSNLCASENAGNTESCSFTNPAAGTWFIGLMTWDAYAGATLRATVTP